MCLTALLKNMPSKDQFIAFSNNLYFYYFIIKYNLLENAINWSFICIFFNSALNTFLSSSQKQLLADVFHIGTLKKFAISKGKKIVLESLFNNFFDIYFIKKIQHQCFPVNIAKFLRAPFSRITYGGCFFLAQVAASTS